jgi:hypothetical protein
MDTMSKDEKILVFFLRFGGGLMLLAFGAILLPESWMAASHRYLGLGEFPASPLVSYLARSAAALYGFHGGLLLVAATDVRRHRAIIRYLAFMNVGFGAIMVGVDVVSGMPSYWTLFEGPPVAGMGILIYFFLRRVEE